jgi:hypothetical protein
MGAFAETAMDLAERATAEMRSASSNDAASSARSPA